MNKTSAIPQPAVAITDQGINKNWIRTETPDHVVYTLKLSEAELSFLLETSGPLPESCELQLKFPKGNLTLFLPNSKFLMDLLQGRVQDLVSLEILGISSSTSPRLLVTVDQNGTMEFRVENPKDPLVISFTTRQLIARVLSIEEYTSRFGEIPGPSAGSPTISLTLSEERFSLGLIFPEANGTFNEVFYNKDVLTAYVNEFRKTRHQDAPHQLSESIQQVSAYFPGILIREVRGFIGKSNADILDDLTTRIVSCETRNAKTKLIQTLSTLMMIPDILRDWKTVEASKPHLLRNILLGLVLVGGGMTMIGMGTERRDHPNSATESSVGPLIVGGILSLLLGPCIPILTQVFTEAIYRTRRDEFMRKYNFFF